jgi:hypothetical protein
MSALTVHCYGNVQELNRCGDAARGLERQSVWKASELRLAKSRERLLLSQLDAAEAALEDARMQARRLFRVRLRLRLRLRLRVKEVRLQHIQ